jgi:hypothetical protein
MTLTSRIITVAGGSENLRPVVLQTTRSPFVSDSSAEITPIFGANRDSGVLTSIKLGVCLRRMVRNSKRQAGSLEVVMYRAGHEI